MNTMTVLKKILWYNMFDLEIKGKDIQLARKGTSLVLAATVLIFLIGFALWNLEFLSSSVSDGIFEPLHRSRGRFLGGVLGLLSIGLFYGLIFIIMGRKRFFEQTLQEYREMSLQQKADAAQKGKYLILIPFVLALLPLFYSILFILG